MNIWELVKFPVLLPHESFHGITFFPQTEKMTLSAWAQDKNWTYIRRSEDIQNVFWTSYVPTVYVLCLRGNTEKLMSDQRYICLYINLI